MKIVSLLLLALSGSLGAAEFQAGLARANITPPLPFYLSGYAARTQPAAVVRSDLWAKALALRDERGERVVFVTMDLIGLPREISDAVAERVRQAHGLQRSQLLLNSSHTHSGPAVWPNLRVLFDFDPAEQERVSRYAARLTDALTALVGAALADLSPAELSCGHGSADFAVNRRQPIPDGLVSRASLKGPVDHDVPVLKVAAPDGRLRAVLFGYACHNTTLREILEVDGDYAGAAQRALERAHPGATALFMILCGGDQNPHPRGTVALAEAHGQSLAAAVNKVLAAPLKPVHGPIRTTYTTTALDLAPHTRAMFEQEAKETHVFKQRRAKLLLAAYDRGAPPRQVACPVQAVRFHQDLTFLALGGEVVVDYALRAKREFPGVNLVVAGYCNDVMCYLPSRRVLREGGYEAVDSMIYYGQPGPFAENVEETVFHAVHQVMEQVGAKPVVENPKPAQP